MDIFKFLPTLQHELGLILTDDDTDLSPGAHRVLLWADQQISHALSMADNKQDWRIDHSAGRPILVYQNCSVIEAEQAEYVLRLIEADRQQRGGDVDAELPPLPPQRVLDSYLSHRDYEEIQVMGYDQDDLEEYARAALAATKGESK